MRITLSFVFAALLTACSPSAPAPAGQKASETVQVSRGSGTGADISVEVHGDSQEAVHGAAEQLGAALEPREFQSPSGNIGCQYVPSGGTETYKTPDGGPQLICDRVAPAYVRFTLSAHGAATLHDHVGDASCCGGGVIAIGAHWSGGPFACDMSEAGIACTNADRHGFTLNRSEARAT